MSDYPAAIAADLDRESPTERGGDDDDVVAFVERHREASLRAFLLRVRRETGRPMTELEHALAELAYGYGFHDGLDLALSAPDEAH